MTMKRWTLLSIAGGAALGLAVGVSLGAAPAHADRIERHGEPSEHMARLERFTTKLACAIDAENSRLTEFYAEEIREAAEALSREVPEHDGLPLGDAVRTILLPLVDPVSKAAKAGAWPEVEVRFAEMIDGCNRCHAAMEHEFVRIRPSLDDPRCNGAQVFARETSTH
jgi:hypothetical protein